MWPFRRRRPAPSPSPATVAENEDDFEDGDGPDSPDDPTHRIVRLHGLLDEALMNEVIQRLLFHQYESRRSPVVLDIDSPGGLVAHTMAVVDTIGFLEAPVHTRCADQAAGGAAIILAAGTRGHRTVGPLAAVALVPISSDEPNADQRALDRDRDRLAGVLAELTGQAPRGGGCRLDHRANIHRGGGCRVRLGRRA